MFSFQNILRQTTRHWLRSGSLVLRESQCHYAKKSDAKKLGLPEEPKQPMTPFIKYYIDNRPEVAAKNPHLRVQDLVKYFAAKWASLDTDIKVKMMKDYRNAKTKYKQDLQDYLESLPAEKRKELEKYKEEKKKKAEQRSLKSEREKMGHPKLPLNAYTLYMSDEMAKVNEKFTKEGMKQFVRDVSQRWQDLPAEGKKRYQERYIELKQNYDKQLLDWEEKMVRLGREDLIRKQSRITKS